MPATAIVGSRWGGWLSYVQNRCASLAKVPVDSIVVRKWPWLRGTVPTAGGWYVTYGGLRRERSATSLYGLSATNLDTVVAYPAQITIVRSSNQDLSHQGDWLQWSEQLTQAFTPRLEPAAPGQPWVETIIVEDGPILDAGAFMAQWDVQALIVKGVGRERRGQVT